MFIDNVKTANNQRITQINDDTDSRKEERVARAIRFMDMQGVISGNLAGPQQAVANAQNYPSTWTTNPDGGANGQI